MGNILLGILILLIAVDLILRLKKIEKPKMQKFKDLKEFKSNTIMLDSAVAPIYWAYLIIKHGLERGKDFKIQKEETKIGRDEGNDIIFSHPTVSRFHAKIIREGENYYIEDLNSANGTFVNGIKIQRELLHDNDILQFGDIVCIFKKI
ncbi:MAG: FHA domain-containing protein [Dictyoglomus sp.]|nr:FHA domain-containing protein [Dictyoglomus sp.]MCX7844986.1 FHA domain-containing protein [Dictyoglomaceae bacterium]MDW8187723.1 FHA domain-containing protein [Dictyoglomus sp.]